MAKSKGTTVVILVVSLSVIAPLTPAQEAQQSEREAMYYRYMEFASYVKGGSVEPHWMADGSSFWYAEGHPASTTIWKVDPRANTKTPLFDTERVREALAAVLGHEPPYEGLPFDDLTFLEGEEAVRFTVEDKEFTLRFDTYTISRVPSLSDEERRRLVPQRIGNYSTHTSDVSDVDIMEILSPDGRWFASVRDYNLWLRSADDHAVPLTTDSIRDHGWGRYWDEWAWWSPNSQKLLVRKGDYRDVPKYPIVDYSTDGVQWVLSDSDPSPPSELFIVDISTKKLVRIDTPAKRVLRWRVLGWRPDGSELLFLRPDPMSTKLDLIAADPSTGSTRIILTESRRPWGLWLQWRKLFTPLEDGSRFIWRSERDGWNHLYLYDLDGNLIRRLTKGRFPVVQVVATNQKAGWVYFTAHGDPERPYDTHLYRVDLEGNRIARLTETTGQHDIQFAPSKEFYLDTHSSVDRPPVVELRRADGTLMATLSTANIEALLQWIPPEEFVVKAADGKTDLYGVLYKPYDFDPKKKYPVIDRIYGGPAIAFVPHTFFPRVLSLARGQLGFIILLVDARGTPERGRKFQEALLGNLGGIQIPDHVAALHQLAATRPYMDLSRVGIHGHSYGGYFAMRGMLLAPDVYHVGVAGAMGRGLSRIGLDGGVPGLDKEAYEYASNPNLAASLKGKLLLLHGTSDACTPVSNTMKMVDALIHAGKDFDFLILPGVGHGYRGTSSSDLATRTYAFEAIRRFFEEHLEPKRVVMVSEEPPAPK